MILNTIYISFRNTYKNSNPYLLMALSLLIVSCKTAKTINYSAPAETTIKSKIKSTKFLTGADNVKSYFSLLKNKKIGIVTNQTGLISYDSIYTVFDTVSESHIDVVSKKNSHIIDYITEKTKIDLVRIYAPEHGFRGTADAGELIVDGKDSKTSLPIVSLYGNNKKPSPEQLAGIEVLVFDLQDVGARFYTFISSLHYIMEACAENNVQLIILDRPNPNGNIVDGPILEKASFNFLHDAFSKILTQAHAVDSTIVF